MTRSSSLQTILLAQLDAIFGLHPGFRPAHAKGAMLIGTFAPSPEARSLTRAPHVTRESTPVTVRFSDGTGLPLIPDNLPDANPRGLAIRFHLADRVHTDIVSHSTVGFPTRTGQEFLDFLQAAATGDPSAFLATHPAALAFLCSSLSGGEAPNVFMPMTRPESPTYRSQPKIVRRELSRLVGERCCDRPVVGARKSPTTAWRRRANEFLRRAVFRGPRLQG